MFEGIDSATSGIAGHPEQIRLRHIIKENQVDGWDKAWKGEVTPWDAGCAQPPLQDLIASGKLKLPKSGRALVPGCGRGYDALVIASELGLDTLAIDISPTAIEAAQRWEYAIQGSVTPKIDFQVKDFFSLGHSEEEHYELVYDYTFFVALPPALRADWGRQMAKIVKSGGYLIALLFPILNQPEDVGPPFYAREEHYSALLDGDWEKVLDEIPENSLVGHKGIEQLMVWRRK
ncbi:S-adenosyl-L-methionine-dependent methyltransferase [Wolfiporia cocos MD-104 SS10]|uniref:S-adenosyl-L-methionine-dependent methyltransferase n=1 Tax=Wolfiporia cocos (strain MD-104) TaxID=742152 RepID=A0A2H3JZ45_WOLCO|nr:S-adenosyl-L-methionine-dependent methyltransferase [Wolfiporia cocos MD-104 SS10]